MKRVWKCDFCHDTNVDPNKMESHEDKCSFNPKNKTCYTCDNCIPGDWPGDGDQCKIHPHSYYWEVEDGEKECNDWVNFKLRIKKIKNIKSKIK
jgi:hypothetical protein